MPEQYAIVGSVPPSDGLDRAGIRVQAFDRDLPSLERRSGAFQLLGEATTDPEGRFEIAYSLDRFGARRESRNRADPGARARM